MSSRRAIEQPVGERWPLPPTPDLVRHAAVVVRTGMVMLGLAWWGSLVADAVVGRVAWSWPVMGAVLLLGWAAVLYGDWKRRASARHPAGAATEPVLCWQEATASWLDAQGQPMLLQVVFDLGRFCLLRLESAADHTGLRRRTHHWIDAGPQAGHLQGPWRWRVMMASSRTSTPPSNVLPNQPQGPAGRPA